jgi:hypothetical protein
MEKKQNHILITYLFEKILFIETMKKEFKPLIKSELQDDKIEIIFLDLLLL